MTRSLGRRLVLTTASLVALVLARHVTYLLAHGPGGYDSAMSATGHDGYWSAWRGAVAVAGGMLIAVAGWQLHRLARLGRGRRSGLLADGRLRDYLGSVGYWWPRLLIGVTLLFLLQENAEHLRVGAGLPGLGVLGLGEYGPAMPVIAALTLSVSAALGLVEWCRRSLLARLQAGSSAPHAPGVGRSTGTADRQLISLLLAQRSCGRAPPPPA